LSVTAVENEVVRYVNDVLSEPGRIEDRMDQVIAAERAIMRYPNREAQGWHEHLTKVEKMRSAYLNQRAEGLITIDELREKLSELDRRRATA
jgi:hypothetical protein